MTVQDDTHGAGDGVFMRAAAVVGDLNSPFYAEERQRDVWNEASAVGFQLMLWLDLVAANVMVWVGGSTGLPYALATIGIVGLASSVVLSYAKRLGVEADAPEHLRRTALMPALGLVMAFFLGVAFSRDWPDSGFWSGFPQGMAVGAAIGVVAAAVGLVRELRRAR
jgi:hypothetical protein